MKLECNFVLANKVVHNAITFIINQEMNKYRIYHTYSEDIRVHIL